METYHAYISYIGNHTVKYANEWIEGDRVTHSYWTEDFKSEPDLRNAKPATFEDVERMCDFVNEQRGIVNLCI